MTKTRTLNFQLACWLGFILPGLFIWWMAAKPHVLIIGLIMCGIWSTDNAVKVFNNKPYR